jgi:serine protease Do
MTGKFKFSGTSAKLFGTVLLAGGLLTGLQTGNITPPKPTAAVADTQAQVRQELGTFAKLAKSMKPSVVNIAVEKTTRISQAPDDLFDMLRRGGLEQVPQKQHGQGSGVIVSDDGYIMTNNHVVSGADDVKVTLGDGRTFKAKVIGTDPKTDLALVKVEATGLPFAPLGDSDALEVGDWVMAIGNPFGLDATVTVGVLSGKGRVIGAGPYDNFLQTDASINPGNSGGPLFNTQGQVVGINTAIIPNGQGIGFSIPVNMARKIVDQLKVGGRVVRGFIGLGAQPLTDELKSALGLSPDVQGALVGQLVPNGPAIKAGVQVQDIVTSLGGQPIRSDRDLLNTAANLPVGQKTQIVVLRAGKPLTLDFTVAERPDDPTAVRSGEQLKTERVVEKQQALGMGISPLSEELANELKTDNLQGVVVAEVSRNSAAARAGLQEGDIIRQVNRYPINGVEDFVSKMKSERKGSNLALLVERKGASRFVVIGG